VKEREHLKADTAVAFSQRLEYLTDDEIHQEWKRYAERVNDCMNEEDEGGAA
jgi:hypothetical protein